MQSGIIRSKGVTQMALTKPDTELVYGQNDVPPAGDLILLSLQQGMLVFAGIVEMFFSRVVSRLRSLFPPLVVGMTVMMVGVSIIPMAFANFCGSPVAGDEVIWQDIVVGCVTLMAIMGSNLWGKGQVKLYCLLIGIFVGWGVALCISPFDPVQYQMIGEVPVFAIPFTGLS
jgi:NCS2 family nucleobase:cation symporter-2